MTLSTFKYGNNGALGPLAPHTHTRPTSPHTERATALTEGQAPAKHSFLLIMPAITGSTLQQLAPRAAEGAC